MGASQSHDQLMPEERKLRQDPEKIARIARYLSARQGTQKSLVSAEEFSQHEQDKQSMKILKGIYKRLDPTIMKSTLDVNGEVQLSFKYDLNRDLLLVKVIRCRELRNRDVRSKASDPYIRLAIIPDSRGQGAKTTQIVVETNEPVFNEIFAFTKTELELLDSKLIVQVWDYDVSNRDDFLGEVIIDMTTFNFKEEPVHTAWYTLKMETDLSISGEMDISMAFQAPDHLYVTVHGATNLSPRDDSTLAEPFVKVSVPGVGMVCKSEVQKNTLNPVWEETFDFQVPYEELSFRYVVLHVIDESQQEGNESLGQVILDLDLLDPEQGYHGTHKLADLKNSERIRNKWSQSMIGQEFRESFQAHASIRHPNFLFQQQSGKKVISVSCRKARSHAKIRIVDGIAVN
ncbi:synaptotagmin-C-like [Haliotis rufescens]|uniref:synaptotagmin-C-like n=1 Tax=Haliotis rufescens TaxID=6454 RepID=UPI00201F224F|nr:synaptotagmin-C-like [Haliotis rufescens]